MSRALPGGMLNSKEKTEYENWLESLHKDIDKIKSEKDTCSMPLMDSECGANGCHNYDGTLMTDKNRVHGVFEAVYYDKVRDDITSNLKKVKESLCLADFIYSRMNEAGENETVEARRNEAIRYSLKDAKDYLSKIHDTLDRDMNNVGVIITQNTLNELEGCLEKTCQTLDKIINVKGADADVVKKSLKDVAGEANSIIKDLTTSLNGLEIDDLIKLKNLDGSNFMGSFEDLMSFNKSVLKGKYFNQSVA